MKLQPAMIFGENMVLQRGMEIPVWGRSVREDLVTVELGSTKVRARAEKGEWCAVLPAMEACEKIRMTISSEKTGERIVFGNAAVGEVWIAAGQSNMEFLLKYDEEAEQLYEEEPDPLLRYFRYPCAAFQGALESCPFPDDGFWRTWESTENRGMFSAPSAYMGKLLRKVLGVPVGFVGCNWGGTPAPAWADMKELKDNPALAPVLAWQEKINEKTDYRTYIAASERWSPELPPVEKERERMFMMGVPFDEIMAVMPPMPVPEGYGPYMEGPRSCIRPSGVFEQMVRKIAPYAARGVIWYQGEDDDFRGWQGIYDESMKAVIRSWRRLWNRELPFLQVELAPFEGVGFAAAKDYPLIRHKQRAAAAALPGVHNVCITDAGHRTNIHVRKKRPVGERLALLARKYVYGEQDLAADSPELLKAERMAGEAADGIRLYFNHADGGMVIRGDLKAAMEITADGTAVEAEAEAQGNALLLRSPSFREAKEICIRYMEVNYGEAALFNGEGLPAFSFTVRL